MIRSNDNLHSITQLLLYTLYCPALSSEPKRQQLVWWEKDNIVDIKIAQAAFEAWRNLDLPELLCRFATNIHSTINFQHLVDEVAKFAAAIPSEPLTLRSFNSQNWASSVSILVGKRLLEDEDGLTNEKDNDLSSISSPSHPSGRIIGIDHQNEPFGQSSSELGSESSGKCEDHKSAVAERYLLAELRSHRGPTIMPVPPITLSADICNGSYQKFYLLLMEIPRSPDIQTKLKELSTSFTDKDRAEKPQNYERAMANVINAIFDVATTTIDKRFSMKAYCSDDVTLLKNGFGRL